MRAAINDAFEKVAPVAAWAVLSFVVFCTLSPIELRPGLSGPASLQHVAAFGLVGLLFRFAYPKRLGFVWTIVLANAILLEMSQLLTPDRHARVHDMIEKIAGGAIGIALGAGIFYLKEAVRSVRS